jgi:signal transduction histidine kinase
MRMYVLLIFAAIMLSFSTAYYAINLQQKTIASTSDIAQIQKYKKQFENQVTPILEIDLSTMYPSGRFAQLLQPSNVFSRENTSKTYFSRPCTQDSEKMSKLFFDKSEIWEDFRCNRLSKLPLKFFDNLPMIHESGVSYAYLAFLSGRDPFWTIDWVRSNLNLFHIYELTELPAKSLEGNFKVLSKLKRPDLEALIKGSTYIITEDNFLVKDRQDFNVTYKVYSRLDLENFFKAKYYFIKPFQEGEQCYYHEGRFCWERSAGTLALLFKQSSIIIFTGSIIVLFLIAVILFRKIKLQKFEEEKKKHALRVLTHELRTPISNLLLQVEQINKQSDLLPVGILDEFLKMESEVYRLKRLAEKSTSYLQTNDRQSLIAINRQLVPSINELVRDMIDDYINKGVIFIPAKNDKSFSLDVYWFSICVKNLVENSLLHGKNPVQVELQIEEDSLLLTVIDHGFSTYKTLDEMLSSDRTGKNSTGLGLGLSIVQNIMKEMDGKITYSTGPTTFVLFLRNKK